MKKEWIRPEVKSIEISGTQSGDGAGSTETVWYDRIINNSPTPRQEIFCDLDPFLTRLGGDGQLGTIDTGNIRSRICNLSS